MNPSANSQFLLIGLPESGKTSFLAALHYYTSSEIENKAMFEYKMSDNATYLRDISSSWIKCKKIGRTSSLPNNLNKEVQIHLQSRVTAKKIDLFVPDLAGEPFLEQFKERYWEKTYFGELQSSSGVILFIHAGKIKPHVLIDDVPTVIQAYADDETIVPFKNEEVPSQVMLVDILNYHSQFYAKVLPVAIVVSAWDEVLDAGEDITPMKWLEISLPLLYQYIICNRDKFLTKVFGISAQGGNITNAESIEQLSKFEEPGDRIIVQEEMELHKNICAPLEWLLSL